jgi:hypothetical protein
MTQPPEFMTAITLVGNGPLLAGVQSRRMDTVRDRNVARPRWQNPCLRAGININQFP